MIIVLNAMKIYVAIFLSVENHKVSCVHDKRKYIFA